MYVHAYIHTYVHMYVCLIDRHYHVRITFTGVTVGSFLHKITDINLIFFGSGTAKQLNGSNVTDTCGRKCNRRIITVFTLVHVCIMYQVYVYVVCVCVCVRVCVFMCMCVHVRNAHVGVCGCS